MSRAPVPFAPDTLESIRRAFRVASDRRHDLVSLEHMLHALLDDPQAREILQHCKVNLVVLKADLEEVLEKAFTPVPGRKWRAVRCWCSSYKKRKATLHISFASRASID